MFEGMDKRRNGYSMKSLEEELNKVWGSTLFHNPYWEKWGRGRPSKSAIEKRKKYYEWNERHNPNILFESIKNSLPQMSIGKDGRILLRYKKRK